MSDPTFAQPERRSYLVPILVALALLAAAIALATHFFPATTVNSAHVHADLLPTHTVYKADTIVVGHDPAVDVLYLAETITIDNQLRQTIDLDGFTLTLTDPKGAELTTRAVTKARACQRIGTLLPQTHPPSSPHPLLPRNLASIPANKPTGTVLFALPVSRQSMYDSAQIRHRQSRPLPPERPLYRNHPHQP